MLQILLQYSVSISKPFSTYVHSHYEDKTSMIPSYLYNGNPYTGKTTSLCYGDAPGYPFENCCWRFASPPEERFEFQINSRFVHSSRNQRYIHVLPLYIDVVLTLFNFYRGQSVVPLLVIFCIKLATCYLTHMMTSSSGNIFHATGLLWGEFVVTSELPPQRPVARSFDVFFDLRPNKRLSKPSRRRWFETLSR